MGKKTSKISDTYRPFENLGSLLKNRSFQLASPGKKQSGKKVIKEQACERSDQENLFREAMSDVVPIHPWVCKWCRLLVSNRANGSIVNPS